MSIKTWTQNLLTAKTVLFRGAAFTTFSASLFWVICLMLTNNAREDYFDKEGDDTGKYGQVVTMDYDVKGQGKA
ncbi:hypothetical protein SLEP1_g36043 [Rubroshorea leprosula]|uniref:Uncharacterized protein n=1 Tax=Rubroshorea leprosula TaxID=152421 RepID=A0AAV5KQR9_9ROSI|nr:hypothetical protein SLEP1_g36043 [Rubroshorea leprosula]